MAESGPHHDVFDVDRIRRLVELMKDHELTEIDLRQGEQKIRLRRDEDTVLTPIAPAASPPMPPAGSGSPPVVREAVPPAQPAQAAEDTGGDFITSPMVGTFYASPSPEAPAYVKVGDAVGKDTTVCIIEAMKVFNEIPAEVSGKIAEVLVENGDAVEFGQKLFRVTTKG